MYSVSTSKSTLLIVMTLAWNCSACGFFINKKKWKEAREVNASEEKPATKEVREGDAKKPEKVAPTVGILTLNDLKKPTDLTMLSRTDIIEKLNNNSVFTNVMPDDGSEAGCLQKKLNETKIKVSGKNTIEFSGSIDMDICSDGDYKFLGLFEYFFLYTCEKEDFSAWNGKSWASVEKELESRCLDQNGAALTHTRFKNRTTAPDYVSSSESLSARITADGSPCSFEKKNGSTIWMNGCQDISIEQSETKSGSETTKELLYWNIQPKDLKADKDGKYYVEGSMKVTLNSWQGTVTFRGRDQLPDYSMASGSDKITGSIDYQPGVTAQNETVTSDDSE